MAWSEAARAAAAEARKARGPIDKNAAYRKRMLKRMAGRRLADKQKARVTVSAYGHSVSRSEMAAHLKAARKGVSLSSVRGNPYARTDKAVSKAVASARAKFGASNPAAGEMFIGKRAATYSPKTRGG